MSNTDLLNFKLLVARTKVERDLVLLLLHADTLAADLRQTDCEKERSAEAVAFVRSRIDAWQRMKHLRSLQLPIPHGLRADAA